MRVLTLLTAAVASLASLTSAADADSASKRFKKYNSAQLSAGRPITINDETFNIITASPRDYSVVVLLTALGSQFGCTLCAEFQPEYDILGKSWSKGDKNGEGKVVFTTLDFANGKETFRKYGLTSAPTMFVFKPTSGPDAKPDNAPVRLDFNTGISKADQAHAWIARQLPSIPHPAIKRPVNYVYITVTITAILGVVSLFTVLGPYVLPILTNRNVWAAGSIGAILMFTSGHMFNHIRKTPYVAPGKKGQPEYIANGFQNQYGLETQIVAAMYGILAFSAISLAIKVPRIRNPRAQLVATLVWAALLLGVYSFLMSVFRMKNRGYPFYLPPF